MSIDVFAADTPWVPDDAPDTIDCDVAVIGAGMGGSTVAWALRDSDARVLVIERGGFLPREEANASARAVFQEKRYANAEPWLDAGTGKQFRPGVYYWVGGCTKVYGACLPRFRSADFDGRALADGPTQAWPVTYTDLEPYYARIEKLFWVHGGPGDPTEPERSTGYPFPPLPHEPEVQRLADSFRRQGLQPFSMPQGVDIRDGGACVRCRTCDGFPCPLGAKADGETAVMRPALRAGRVRLLTHTRVERLCLNPDGTRAQEIVAFRNGHRITVRARNVVVAAGAVNTAALLMRSGIQDDSGQLGRNYMVHNSTFMIGIDPRRINGTYFQKTLGINDWYDAGDDRPYPLGNLQMLGRLEGSMVKAFYPYLPEAVLTAAMRRSIDVYLTTEDLPLPHNRIDLTGSGQIRVHWKPSNLGAHRALVSRARTALRRAGYPLVLTRRMGIETNSHQCGTARMSLSPDEGVTTPDGRLHAVENVWLADSSVFCSSAAVNPALTIGALALRLVERAKW